MTKTTAVCYLQAEWVSVSRYRLIQNLSRLRKYFQNWLFFNQLLPSDFYKHSDNSAQLHNALHHVEYIIFSVSWLDTLRGITPLPLASLITIRYTTLGRTPLHEWSASSRELCLTAHNTHKRRASTTPPPQAGFKPAIPTSDRHYSHTGHWDWQPM